MVKFYLENSVAARCMFYQYLSVGQPIRVSDIQRASFIEKSGIPENIADVVPFEIVGDVVYRAVPVDPLAGLSTSPPSILSRTRPPTPSPGPSRSRHQSRLRVRTDLLPRRRSPSVFDRYRWARSPTPHEPASTQPRAYSPISPPYSPRSPPYPPPSSPANSPRSPSPASTFYDDDDDDEPSPPYSPTQPPSSPQSSQSSQSSRLAMDIIDIESDDGNYADSEPEPEPEQDEPIIPNPDGNVCIICVEAKIDSIYLPCRHMVSCTSCMESWEKESCIIKGLHTCPLCIKQVFDTVKKIFRR